MRNHLVLLFLSILLCSCNKEEDIVYFDQIKKIKISEDITIDNGVRIHDPNMNLLKYEDFLQYIVSSNKFLIVSQKEFPSTFSNDKVVISLRYDVDENINNAVKFAYRENKYGIKSTYFILHSASYYGKTSSNRFIRNNRIIDYIKKIQNNFGQEIGWHNDLVTLQVVYDINSKYFLHEELKWLRNNGINIQGTVAHGSPYCYKYHYVNSYFWNHTEESKDSPFYNYEYVPKDDKNIKIEKDDLSSYNLTYDANLYTFDYFFADCNRVNGKLWHMGMVNFDTIQPGKKVIILLHPQYWN